jgi:branched-chain amino acid aminotransferase
VNTTIDVIRAATRKPKPHDSELRFGTVFTDHMATMTYEEGAGWSEARIEPYHQLAVDPAAAVLHYAQAIFDGAKAFRGQDGVVRVFRPRKHFERMQESAARLCIPAFDADRALRMLITLLEIEQEWVPRTPGTALYIRPVIIATEPFLGVRPARSYLFYIILSPVGSYYDEGMRPLRILVSDRYVRAVEGGVGAAKTSGNYAASLLAAEEAHRAGFAQVLWLDGVQRRYIDEVGTMNIMVRIGDEVITPPLSGTILPGVTRDSVLSLLRQWGVAVAERPITIDEVIEAAQGGLLREVWGTGTAAVISPVGELSYRGQSTIINESRVGELTQRLYDAITAIQYARVPDTHGWMAPVGA